MDFLVSKAYAGSEVAGAAAEGNLFMMNISMIIILALLFYGLLIMPQQKRFKKHRQMLDKMKKGDKVLTAGGFIGKVHKVDTEKNEVVVDLGNDIKVTALRSTIQTLMNDDKAA